MLGERERRLSALFHYIRNTRSLPVWVALNASSRHETAVSSRALGFRIQGVLSLVMLYSSDSCPRFPDVTVAHSAFPFLSAF